MVGAVLVKRGKFIGLGEQPDDLQPFDAKQFAQTLKDNGAAPLVGSLLRSRPMAAQCGSGWYLSRERRHK
jgi:hypothetical protein